MDTIYALSSGALPAGVGIVRISGPDAGMALRALAGGLPEARRAVVRALVDPESRDVIDVGLVLWMPGPGTFTGEDTVELQCHGSRAVIARLIESLAQWPGLRMAEPGEFARRAFLNGRLDLTEAEGLADLVAAETEAQRRQALRQARGAMAERLLAWRETLLGCVAEVEAQLDFSDEGDVGSELEVASRLRGVLLEVRELLSGARLAERVRDGFVVVLVGAPNAGKSTLLNAFARRDVAIVSAEPGTTRDLVSVPLELSSYAVTLIDTAGLRETVSTVEAEGVRRARVAAEEADLVLELVPAGQSALAADAPATSGGPDRWVIETKVDLVEGGDLQGAGRHRVSAVTGVGLRELELALGEWLARQGVGGSAGTVGAVAANARQREGLLRLAERLESVLKRGQPRGVDELLGEELRACLRAIGRVTGEVDPESVLGAIFGRFCIGK
ncbi:tRNA uridine-5-carboxymethylaminomethyl(34) synthesis GTPase MnmE [Afifella sp. YEN Y35]|uniref:tRNA uridine-5-carboxymethylaminomethyl(34) synthesis GTPase MnmE n=1 Tax=Afifella sp. YEN Y35 TaxID=3388337 RepID=UPI0039DFBD18